MGLRSDGPAPAGGAGRGGLRGMGLRSDGPAPAGGAGRGGLRGAGLRSDGSAPADDAGKSQLRGRVQAVYAPGVDTLYGYETESFPLRGVMPAHAYMEEFVEHVRRNTSEERRAPQHVSPCRRFSTRPADRAYAPGLEAPATWAADDTGLAAAMARAVIGEAVSAPWPRNFNLDADGYCTRFDTTLGPDCSRTEYKTTRHALPGAPKDAVDVFHTHRKAVGWPMRKVHVMDIEFLTEHARLGPEGGAGTAVFYYNVSEPCAHANLEHLFAESCVFHVLQRVTAERDTPEFWDGVRDRVAAERAAGMRVLYVDNAPRSEHCNGGVARAMDEQRWVHEHVQPDVSFLRFRLPYCVADKPTFAFLAGTVYFPVWGRQSSTETKIAVQRDAPVVDYDLRDIESAMYHHNKVTRYAIFSDGVHGRHPDTRGVHSHGEARYCGCYDCTREARVLADYARRWVPSSRADPGAAIARLAEDIDVALCGPLYIYQDTQRGPSGSTIWQRSTKTSSAAA
jgi:hypothetical protein